MNLLLMLRITGGSLILLSLSHAVLWRALDWGPESKRLSPMNARVFAIHTFFIAFVLLALGLLSVAKAELLLDRSDLARMLLFAIVVFWLLRLMIQPFVFHDPAMKFGWVHSPLVRVGAFLLFLAYVLIYGAALLGQLAPF